MKIKSYIYTFFITIFLLLSVFGVGNYLIDPYGIWGNKCWENINCRKTQAGKKIYLTKANQWKHADFSGLIMGNSRTELGMDPSDFPLTSDTFYNLSIRGSSLPSTAIYFQNIVRNKDINHILLGIDFFSFRERPGVDSQWPPSLPEYLPYDVYGKAVPHYAYNQFSNSLVSLVSLQTTIDSLLTLFNQGRLVSYLEADGYEQSLVFTEMTNNEGARAIFEHDLGTLDTKFNGVEYQLYDDNGISRSFEALNLIVALAKEHNIKLSIMINPVHATYLKKLSATGHFELYLSWKKELVAHLTSIDFFANYQLFDFSGFHYFNLEKVPLKKGRPMEFWFEAAHYKPKLGKFMAKVVLSGDNEYLLSPTNLKKTVEIERMAEANTIAKDLYLKNEGF